MSFAHNFKNLVGKQFGCLMAIGVVGRSSRGELSWEYRCQCGVMGAMLGSRLSRIQHTCWHQAHRHSRHPAYRCWAHMVARCRCATDEKYPLYGGSGVVVFEPWVSDFAAFLAHIGERPSSKHSIDRYPNPYGNYEPGNVRWATAKEQSRNKRNNIYVEYQGRMMLLADLAEQAGLSLPMLYGRLKMGWGLERALTRPVRKKTTA